MRISIIIPAFNIKECLRYSVESALSQCADCDIEIVIVDDGSTDGTASICDRYAAEPQVIVIHKPNGGLSSARNAGINASTGDFIMFLDGDDYLAKGTIAYLVDIIRQTAGKFSFIQYRYIEVPDYNHRIDRSVDSEAFEICNGYHELFSRMLSLGGIGASACTKLINRKALGALRFKEGIIYEDEQFTAQLISKSTPRVIYTDTRLYCYVMRQGSIIKSDYTSKKLDIIPVLQEHIATLTKFGFNDLADKVRVKFFISLVLLYAKARIANATNDSRIIKQTIIQLLNNAPVRVKGKFGIIAAGIKMHLPSLSAYYYYTKLFNGKN